MFAARMAMDVVATQARWSPRNYPNLSAWYDPSDRASMVIDGSNRVSLIADKSGNSAVNCLCLNGASGNYASVPDSAALSITGSIDLRADVALDSWTPSGSNQWFLSKALTDGQSSYDFGIEIATGYLWFRYSPTGTFAALRSAKSSVATGFSAYARRWVRATYNSATGYVTFYTSTDGTTWVQIGTVFALTAGSIFDGTNALNIGAGASGTAVVTGKIYRAQVLNGIGGTVAFDANFALASKLDTSVVESSANAATVTINSSGDLGARISGERDLVQLTASKQPIYTASGTYLTFDGTDDYMKAAAFSLSQPETVYFVGQMVTWANGTRIVEGGSSNTSLVYMADTTPKFRVRSGVVGAENADLSVGSNGVITAVFNGASSLSRVNRLAAVTTDAGTTAANGFTVGGNASTGANSGNIRANAVAIYSAAHATATQNDIINGLGAAFGINTEPLTASVSQSSISASGANGTVSTGNVTASGVNGTPGYTYSWSRISGDTQISATASTSATTAFSATGTNVEYTATFRVTVTDAGGSTATADAVVVIIIGTPP